MPSLIKQHGHFYLQFYDKLRSPKRKRIALRTTVKRDAQTKRRELESAHLAGEFDPWHDNAFNYRQREYAPETIAAALDSFLAQKRRDGRRETTLRTYWYVVGTFARGIGEETLLDDLTPAQVEAFTKDADVAEATRCGRYRRLRAFFAWCREQEVMRRDPLEKMDPPRETEKLPRAVTPDDLHRIEEAMREDYADKLKANLCRRGEIVWMIPLFRFALYTGLRVSELARLRWQDVDRERRVIRVHVQKNRRAQTVPLHTKAEAVLDDVPEGEGDDFVFRNPAFTAKERSSDSFRNGVSRAFTRYRRAAGLRHLSFHGLRHGHCTLLAEAGASAFVIQAAARHADVQTSQRYVSIANEHLKAELESVFK